MMRTAVGRRTAAEGLPQRPQRILVGRAAIGERDAQEGELLGQRPDADPEDEPTARDAIERAVPLRDRERVMVAENEDMGEKPDARRLRGEEAERREGIVVARAPDR